MVTVLILACMYILQGSIVIGQYIKCNDSLDPYTCNNWLMHDMCIDENYRSLMVQNCQKTCNFCNAASEITFDREEQSCRDSGESCLKWRRHCEEGGKHYNFMKRNCQRTCLFCADKTCIDKNTKCKYYRNRGYCRRKDTHHGYMKKNCEKSCKFCLPLNEDRDVEYNTQINNYIEEFLCDFEINECDWSNQIFEDTADWAIGIDNYGPKTGFNNSGKYIYLNAEYADYYAYLWLPWELILPNNTKERGEMCLHLMYQMDDCTMSVYEKATPTLSNKYPSAVLKYTTENKATTWTHVKVNVYVSERYYLLIKGVKGHPESYLAIDRAFFSDGECY